MREAEEEGVESGFRLSGSPGSPVSLRVAVLLLAAGFVSVVSMLIKLLAEVFR